MTKLDYIPNSKDHPLFLEMKDGLRTTIITTKLHRMDLIKNEAFMYLTEKEYVVFVRDHDGDTYGAAFWYPTECVWLGRQVKFDKFKTIKRIGFIRWLLFKLLGSDYEKALGKSA